MAYTKVFGIKFEVTNIITGEHDYILHTDEPDPYIFHLQRNGQKTQAQMDQEGWYPGNRDHLTEYNRNHGPGSN